MYSRCIGKDTHCHKLLFSGAIKGRMDGLVLLHLTLCTRRHGDISKEETLDTEKGRETNIIHTHHNIGRLVTEPAD